MPLYEYRCLVCGKHFEELQSFKDKPLETCKFCEGKVERVISQTSFSLKGGGWYKDGYSKSPPTEKKPGKEVKSGPESKTSGGPKTQG